MNRRQLEALVARGESETVELKKSTGDLRGGMESLCAFLNGQGGAVAFGIKADGKMIGQDITDATVRDVAAAIAKLDPPVSVTQNRMAIDHQKEVLLLQTGDRSGAPYTFDGRPFQRVGSTTSLMPQAQYQRRLIERGHVQVRWENQTAAGYCLRDLDRREIVRTVREALNAGRLEGTVESPDEVLRKLP